MTKRVDEAGEEPMRMRRGWARGLGLLAGLAADYAAPDPPRAHPVAAFGALAVAAERRMWTDGRVPGLAYALGCAGLAAATGRALDRAGAGSRPAAAVTTAACTWAVVGQAGLAREAGAMRAALVSGDLAAARDRLPHLCGRDPSRLGERELARATVESVAENTADAVVAPLLWGAAFGPAGLLGYRAVNTLDAMVGHLGQRYGRFGWASARLDDGANWMPARVTALLTVAAAPLAGGSARRAWRVLRRDRRRHPSPNAGWCEAAAAGALGVRLGGANAYAHGTEHRPELGDGRAVVRADIGRAVLVSRAAGAGAAVLAAVVAAVLAAALPPGPASGRAAARRVQCAGRAA